MNVDGVFDKFNSATGVDAGAIDLETSVTRDRLVWEGGLQYLLNLRSDLETARFQIADREGDCEELNNTCWHPREVIRIVVGHVRNTKDTRRVEVGKAEAFLAGVDRRLVG